MRTIPGESGGCCENRSILSLSRYSSAGGPKGYKWAYSSAPWASGMSIPAVLTIGGSDPSGGAGIQVSMVFQRCLVILTLAIGGLEDVHCAELLRVQCHNSANRAEHYRCAWGPSVPSGIRQCPGEPSTPCNSSDDGSREFLLA